MKSAKKTKKSVRANAKPRMSKAFKAGLKKKFLAEVLSMDVIKQESSVMTPEEIMTQTSPLKIENGPKLSSALLPNKDIYVKQNFVSKEALE